MNRNEIGDKVLEVADRFGSRNRQQLVQLEKRFREYSPEELFYGLYKVFLLDGENYFERQQLAGRLLYKIRPKLHLDLRKIVWQCLETYNPSVEELPWYLASLCKKERVVLVLAELKNGTLTEKESISIKTFEFWLKRI